MTLSKNKVVLGLSGGVDSTSAALLLKEKGLEVIGFYFDVLGNNEEGRKAAEDLANHLDIPFIAKDVSADFERIVIGNFCQEYACGRTPNPCTLCNPTVKFKQLIDVANEVGAYYIATGHYAKIQEKDGIYYVEKGSNEKKDQSYMLCKLGQDVLSRLIFPLGEIQDKEQTRQMAREANLPNADNADSQEICFINDKIEKHTDYIQRRGFKPKKGNFVDADGKVLGQHHGLLHYTIGQRKGLGIALGKPAFVVAMDPKTGDVVLGDNADLFKIEVVSKDNFFVETGLGEIPARYGETVEVLAKIRYAAKPALAVVKPLEDGRLLTVFEEPQRAATPGQTIVFYKDEVVIGGGVID
ncbi:MAG: tRNA 2-thiouridine(34) synthase MnmA [Firmicutes bacterium]|nr:tRNA 2-thiouridine(34) synthase MnmA [Bacillota bacterium]